MQFFRYFPTVTYTFIAEDGTRFTYDMTNLSVHVKVIERLRQNITVFYDYIIADGERPDSIADKIYGSVNYTWIILLLNGIFTLYDWPLVQSEFIAYLTEKYGSVASAQSTLLYKTNTGMVVDAMTYGLLPGNQRGGVYSAYDDELAKNEAKRRIKVVPSDFIGSLVSDMQAVLAN
jgi:hypothetical protein